LAADLDVAQTTMIASTALVIVLAAIVGFVALGFYRARQTSASTAQYRALAERTADAEERNAEAASATTAELQGMRVELRATRDELVEVRQRLTELERLLSQIG
jgi:hypothetical protein